LNVCKHYGLVGRWGLKQIFRLMRTTEDKDAPHCQTAWLHLCVLSLRLCQWGRWSYK